MSEKLTKIAVIADAHGIRGEVKLLPFVEGPDFFQNNPVLFDAAGKETFSVTISGQAKKCLIARIEGVVDRNAAELLKGKELFVPESVFPQLEEGEFYHSQLVGLEVRSVSGKRLGTVAAIHNYGAGDIIEMSTTSGASEMLPMVEPWVQEINAEQGVVVVTQVEYL